MQYSAAGKDNSVGGEKLPSLAGGSYFINVC